MLGFGFSRKPCRVSRQKRERRSLVTLVLGEIEVHTPDQVPGRMSPFEELLHGDPGISQFDIKGCIHASPKIGQNGRRQIFCARHRRNSRRYIV